MNQSQLRGDLPEPVRRYFLEVAQMQPPAELLGLALQHAVGKGRQRADVAGQRAAFYRLVFLGGCNNLSVFNNCSGAIVVKCRYS